jgi:hydrogenase maturation protein HypF
LRPAARVALGDLAAETPPSVVSARFHETVVAATASVARAVLRERGRLPVVLTGGCFHNARLAEGLVAALAPEHDVFLPGEVPPGDGGLAVGQAVLADALCG